MIEVNDRPPSFGPSRYECDGNAQLEEKINSYIKLGHDWFFACIIFIYYSIFIVTPVTLIYFVDKLVKLMLKGIKRH